MEEVNTHRIYEDILHYMNQKLPYYAEITCKDSNGAFFVLNDIVKGFRYDPDLISNPEIHFDYHYVVGNVAQVRYITIQQKDHVYSIRFVRHYNSNKIEISAEFC